MILATDYADEKLAPGESYIPYNILDEKGNILYRNVHLRRAKEPAEYGSYFGAADINATNTQINSLTNIIGDDKILSREKGGTGVTSIGELRNILGFELNDYTLPIGSGTVKPNTTTNVEKYDISVAGLYIIYGFISYDTLFPEDQQIEISTGGGTLFAKNRFSGNAKGITTTALVRVSANTDIILKTRQYSSSSKNLSSSRLNVFRVG